MNQDIAEAISAGERALSSLRQAREKLDSAGTWGIIDMLGGGFITDMLKHSKMEDASRCIEAAKAELRTFVDELDDVDILPGKNLDMSEFLSFADFFFDGIAADFFVQSKISDAKKKVDEAIREVSSIVNMLRDKGRTTV